MAKKNNGTVPVEIGDKTFQLPKDWQKLTPKQMILVYKSLVTSKTTPEGLASRLPACLLCVGCNKTLAACSARKEITNHIKGNPNFSFFKKQTGPKDAVSVVQVSDDATPEEVEAFYAEVQKIAATCTYGAPTARKDTLVK